MTNEFIISALVYTIVMVIFHLLRDVILKGHKTTLEQKSKMTKRWLLSYGIGIVILYVIY
jgi:high-affinity K+ transport system ATPase subunit B